MKDKRDEILQEVKDHFSPKFEVGVLAEKYVGAISQRTFLEGIEFLKAQKRSPMSENYKEIEALAKIGTCLEMAWEDKRETFYAFTPAQLQKVIDTIQSTFEAQLEAARREGFKAARTIMEYQFGGYGYRGLLDLTPENVRKITGGTCEAEFETEDEFMSDYKKQNGEKQ